MNTQDKELWLIRHGSIDTFGLDVSDLSHRMEWTSWGRLHTVMVYGIDDYAITSLYDKIKDSLYSIIKHMED